MKKLISLILFALLAVSGAQVANVTINPNTGNVTNSQAINFATGKLKLNGVTLEGTYQPLNSKLSAISALGNSAGVLTNDGSGGLSWTAVSATLTANSTLTSGFTSGQALISDGTKLQSLTLGTLATQSGTFSGTSSGTNTGDNAINSLYSGLAASKADVGQTFFLGTTSVAINRTTGALALTGITSIDGNAATVTTNANLTGVITSVGNATSIASQTGTGTKFVVDTGPTIDKLILTASPSVPASGISIGAVSGSFAFRSATSQLLEIDASALTGTQLLTAPDASGTILLRDNTATIVNKTINLSSNTLVFSSAQLATACTNETGSGSLVFATSPTLTTPAIASFASATHSHQNAAGGGTLAGDAISGGTFGAVDGSALTALTAANITASTTVGRNLLNLTNPSAVTWNRVNADNTVSSRTAAQTLSDIGAQASGTYVTSVTGTANNLTVTGTTAPTLSTQFTSSQVLTATGMTAGRTVTVPDAAWTAARTDAAQTFTGVQTMTSAALTTPTVAEGTFTFATTSTPSIQNASFTTSGINFTRDGTPRGVITFPTSIFRALRLDEGGAGGNTRLTVVTGSLEFGSNVSMTGTLSVTGAVTQTAKTTTYNNIATVSNGVPAEYATVDLTAQTAAKTATTIYTPTATGMYRVSVYLQVTTAASTSSVLGGTTGVVVTYNDGDGNVAQSDTVALMTTAGAVALNSAGNTTATNLNGSTIIYAKTGVAIQYAIDYTSVGVTPMQFAAHLKVEAL